ncbi:MAG TPA: 30S ribosomal protein S1 [Sandaracinaceae bacterium LLY-WYZ-13_1]|nr:30S ribosomal protein S1 [Sandaracinaceae bacterium LLY-WYZ-13_1]
MAAETQTSASGGGESFAALFEASVAQADELREGDIVSGTVLSIAKDSVVVDIGYKSEGMISLSEFADPSGDVQVTPGDRVDVLIEAKETEDGLVLLSKEKADKLKVWDEISAACERDELIEGTITARVKGGLSVTIKGGVKAFLPGSQVDLRPVRNLDKLIGQTYEFKVIKFNKKRGNIVLSRRVLLEKERDELKARTLQNLEEGMVVTGVIKNITEYGAFVDLGGIDGLLHITDMSWGRVNHPSEVFNVGDEVTVKVLKYNPETERVSLGLKQTVEDPWNNAAEKYPVGAKVEGKVVSITDYGAFVELEPGIEGLIHVSEMSWRKPKHPSKLLDIGQEVETVILDVDVINKRISLGLKQLEPDPWDEFTRKYNPGDIIRGKVRSVTDYGVFVGIEEGVDGMVHKSDLSWTQRINNPSDVYRKGDEVEAIILSINHDEKKVSLGIKQLYEDPWTRIPVDYPSGTILEVRVVSIAEFGVFVELERGIEGLVPLSELSYDRIDDPRQVVKEGQIVKSEIIDVNPSDRRITLSLKKAELENLEALKFDENRGAKGGRPQPQRKVGPSGGGGATLGDVLKAKLGDLGVQEGEGEEPAASEEGEAPAQSAEDADDTDESGSDEEE